MTQSERILAALKGQPVDRTPVSLYEIDGFGTRYSPDHPSYSRIREYVRENLDNMVMETPVVPGPLGFLYTGGDYDRVATRVHHEGPDEITVTTIETPLGPLTTTSRLNADTYTVWTTEHLVKNFDDVDRLLSLPYVPLKPDMTHFDAMKETVGSRGILMSDVLDPIVMVSSVMSFNDYILLATLDRTKFRRLLDYFAERMHDWLDAALIAGCGPLFRIVGPELCTPPYMPPSDFREFIVEYDTPLIRKIQKAGCLARIHCHGNIAKVADMMLEMKPDALDPIEEPPGGDIIFAEAKRILGGEICLLGNIQESMFELKTPEEVVAEVRRIRSIGEEGGRFVLMPTATPITVPLPARLEETIFAYMEAGLS